MPERFPPAPYRVRMLAGTPREIGAQLGRLDPPFHRPPWWPPPPDPELAEACRRLVARWHPPLIKEYEGYAAAQGMDPRLLWQQVCRTSMRARLFACSAGAVWGPAGAWVGRNYDFRPIQRRRDLVGLRPEGCLASLGMMGSVPGGRYDGVNEAGLFVSLHAVMADEPPPRPGIPFHLIPRILLERCRSAGEAVELLLRMPHMLPLNLLVADPQEGFAVEIHPLCAAVRLPEDGILTVTKPLRASGDAALWRPPGSAVLHAAEGTANGAHCNRGGPAPGAPPQGFKRSRGAGLRAPPRVLHPLVRDRGPEGARHRIRLRPPLSDPLPSLPMALRL
jgi:hypothetical protein